MGDRYTGRKAEAAKALLVEGYEVPMMLTTMRHKKEKTESYCG
jgi:hypothetical protein